MCSVRQQLRDHAQIAESGPDEIRTVLEFVKQFSTIRVEMAATPGNGHQAAAILIVKKLRSIGCPGTIELIYPPATKRKLEYLLPPFSAQGPAHQTLKELNVEVYPEHKILPHLQIFRLTVFILKVHCSCLYNAMLSS